MCPSRAVCRAGALIADLELPKIQRLPIRSGSIKGGTTVNTIAARCEVDVDMRSVDFPTSKRLKRRYLAAFEEAVHFRENAHWPKADEAHRLEARLRLIGNRPAGLRPNDCPAVQLLGCFGRFRD